MSGSENTTIDDDERDWTRQEWCTYKHISKSTYLKMKKAGLTPDETVVMLPGFNLRRITAQARRNCDRKLAELQQSKQTELERERRQAQVVQAAKLAAKSPNHVSRRARPAQRRRPRR